MTLNDHHSLLFECGLNPNLLEFYPANEDFRDGLSRRDIAYCYLVSRGVERIDAFRVAYSSKLTSPMALKEGVSRTMRNPAIHEELRRLIDSKDAPSPTCDAMWLQRTVLKEMLAVLKDPKSNPLTRVRAGEIILKHIGTTVTELAKLIGKPETAHNALDEIERILRENTGGPITRAQLTNGQAEDSLSLD